MESFITYDEFSILFRPLDVNQIVSFELKAQIVSDAIRQEAKNYNFDIDEKIKSKEVYPNVLKEITATVLARWITQPTDFPSMDSVSDPFDINTTWYNSSNMGIVILKKELKRLGVFRQTMFTLGGSEDECIFRQ